MGGHRAWRCLPLSTRKTNLARLLARRVDDIFSPTSRPAGTPAGSDTWIKVTVPSGVARWRAPISPGSGFGVARGRSRLNNPASEFSGSSSIDWNEITLPA
jgi:hypothetical protein